MARNLSFFDPDKARGPRRGPDAGSDVTADLLGDAAAAVPLTVTHLLARIKGALSDAFPQRLAVVGELSNVKRHSSGHLYFRLKDAGASIDAAMFRQHASRLRFTPSDVLEVVVEGRVDVYDVRGQLQLYAEAMTPKGTGALELAFRQLREKLSGEGLFDAAAKKPIPRFPRAIGVVSSPTGAAIRDIARTLRRRWPAARVYLAPARVQGENAAAEVAEGIALLDAAAEKLEIDTLIVARGGGSLEDLWAFNEEAVARAIFAARTPIVCGVGHEVDVTIADLTADLRAPTPTGAAELTVPDAAELRQHVRQLVSRLDRCTNEHLARTRAALDAVQRSSVFRDPTARLRTQAQRLDELSHRLAAGARDRAAAGHRRLEPLVHRLHAIHPIRLVDRARARLDALAAKMRWGQGARAKRVSDTLVKLAGRLEASHPRHRLKLAAQHLSAIERQLDAMSYRSVLGRGFSVTRSGGKILRSVQQVRPGQAMETELADGKFTSTADLSANAAPPSPPPEPVPPKRATRSSRPRAEDTGSLFD